MKTKFYQNIYKTKEGKFAVYQQVHDSIESAKKFVSDKPMSNGDIYHATIELKVIIFDK